MSQKECVSFLIVTLGAPLLLTSVSCGEHARQKAPSVEISPGVVATVEVRYSPYDDYVPADNSIVTLFDGDVTAAWPDKKRRCGDEGIGFRFNLNKPLFLRSVSLAYAGTALPRSAGVRLSYSGDIDGPAIYAESSFSNEYKQQIPLGQHGYFGVLSGSSIEVATKGCTSENSKTSLSEITFNFTTKRPFVPEMSPAAAKATVRKLCEQEFEGGRFCDDRSDPHVEKLMAHLMYLGMRGDREADSLLRSFKPTRADLSEDASMIEEYYALEKARKR